MIEMKGKSLKVLPKKEFFNEYPITEERFEELNAKGVG